MNHRGIRGEKLEICEKDGSNDWVRYVIFLSPTSKKISKELVRQHVSHLKELDGEGKLIFCGPFLDQNGGIVIVRASSPDEARAIAERDPFVKSGVEKYNIRAVEVSCAQNNHLGMG